MNGEEDKVYPNPDDDDDYDDGSYDDDYDYEYYEADCGFIPGMGCSKVGSEECDFECPFSDENERSLIRSEAARRGWQTRKMRHQLQLRLL